jgi:meso-butanediol dehydrogenase / (S,S)-butanediol dehydrogenase / diacetyl reductase
MASLQNKVAIVTGGAMGIGGSTSRKLAAEGAKVIVADYVMEAAEENVARIKADGGEARALHVDVSTAEDIEQMVADTVGAFGGVHILVNNAWGSKERDGTAETVTESAWQYGLDVMVRAHFLAMKHAVPHMRKAGGGAVVNISSVHGLLMSANHLVYETAKSAVVGMTKQMACDFGPDGIRVNAICPGHIVTERIGEMWIKNPEKHEFFVDQYPVRRTGLPEDIANAVSFLVSDEASFITGHALPVDGGLTIQLQENFGVRQAKYVRDHPDLDA